MKLKNYMTEKITPFSTKKLSNDTRRIMAQVESAAAKGRDLYKILVELVENAYQDGYDKGYDEGYEDNQPYDES